MKDHSGGECFDERADGVPPLVEPITIGQGRTAVNIRIMRQGRDFVALITGGTAHVGAIAVCHGRGGRAHSQPGEGVVQLPNHREGPLASEAAETLALATGRTCAAVVGIHQDDATPDEIHDIVTHVRQGLQQLAGLLAKEER